MGTVTNEVYTVLAAASALTALVSSRIYPTILPQGATLPAIVFTPVGGARVGSLSGESGLGNPRIQLDAYVSSESQAEGVNVAETIIAAARSAMCGSTTLRGVAGEITQTWEDSPMRWRCSCDVFVWVGDDD